MQVFVWRDRHKPRKILVNRVDILANFRISHLLNKKSALLPLKTTFMVAI
jgi:hypothetical protein